jgi:hypothetical protein
VEARGGDRGLGDFTNDPDKFHLPEVKAEWVLVDMLSNVRLFFYCVWCGGIGGIGYSTACGDSCTCM